MRNGHIPAMRSNDGHRVTAQRRGTTLVISLEATAVIERDARRRSVLFRRDSQQDRLHRGRQGTAHGVIRARSLLCGCDHVQVCADRRRESNFQRIGNERMTD